MSIARRAGVGERTLYRRFPSKADLVRAALDQSIAENLSPAIERRCGKRDPLQGIAELIEAATSFGAREHNILAAARRADALTNVSDRTRRGADDLMPRAQQAGLVRADLVAEDLPRIIMMLNSVLWTMDPWQRRLAAIRRPDARRDLHGRELSPAGRRDQLVDGRELADMTEMRFEG